MSQRQQLERIMEIDRRIRAGEYPNAERMAQLLEVSRRVIFNDRDF
jgi:predicted DNA-binding transcriptional regulator YafY